MPHWLLVSEDNLDDLTSAIVELVRNPDRARQMGARARAYVEKTYAVHRLHAHLADLFDVALGVVQRPQSDTNFSRAFVNDAA